jgi:hypothetical protein
MGVARLQNDKGKYVTDFNDINFINESIQAIEKLIILQRPTMSEYRSS